MPAPLGEGRGEVSVWWESPGGPGFLPDFTCRILPKDVLSFFSHSSAAWGHKFSQNNLHCDHLSTGRGSPASETRSLNGFISQLSLNIKEGQQRMLG